MTDILLSYVLETKTAKKKHSRQIICFCHVDESINNLPDQRPTFDKANGQLRVLRESLMCKELITMAALALF